MPGRQTTLALTGGLMLVVASIVFIQTDTLGFPDGHLTRLDQALQPLGYSFVFISVLAGLGLLLPRIRVKLPRTANYYRAILIGYLVMALLVLLIRLYLSYLLDDGAGG